MKKFKKNQSVYMIDPKTEKVIKCRFAKYWGDHSENEHSCQIIDERGQDWTEAHCKLFNTAEEAIDNHIDELILKLVKLVKMRDGIECENCNHFENKWEDKQSKFDDAMNKG